MNITELAQQAAKLSIKLADLGQATYGDSTLNTGGLVPSTKPEPGKDVDMKPVQLQQGLTQMLKTTEESPTTPLLRQ